eukprot:1193368-Prorocentrum_minimum.AAC.3
MAYALHPHAIGSRSGHMRSTLARLAPAPGICSPHSRDWLPDSTVYGPPRWRMESPRVSVRTAITHRDIARLVDDTHKRLSDAGLLYGAHVSLSTLARLAPAPGICSPPSRDWLALR